MSTYKRPHKNFLGDKLFDWAFGDEEDDINKALLQASDEFKSKIMPRATAPSLALAPSRAPPATSATCHQPNPLPLLHQAPPIGLLCQKHHCGSTELHHACMALQKLEPHY